MSELEDKDANSRNAPNLGAVKELSIDKVIDDYMLKISDIVQCYKVGIKAVGKYHVSEIEKNHEIIKNYYPSLKSDNRQESINAIKHFLPADRNLDKLLKSNLIATLKNSLFVGLFNVYDVFTGDLLRCLFQLNPEYLGALSDKDVAFSLILKSDNLDDIKKHIVESYIDSFRRSSYVEQIGNLEKLFHLDTLKKFTQWDAFVEAGQRRNLITHCGGVVTQQYIDNCRQHTSKPFHNDLLNKKLEIDHDYFIDCCSLMSDVGLMLGQTLWRKVAPGQIGEAARHLNHVVYEELRLSKLRAAERHAIFATSKMMHKSISELDKNISIVNHALSHYLNNDIKKSKEIISQIDTSALIPEFRLASQILTEDYEAAAKTMQDIGKAGKIMAEEYYAIWPLFNKFRETREFLESYESIFGYSFGTSINTENQAEKTLNAVEKVIEENTKEGNLGSAHEQ